MAVYAIGDIQGCFDEFTALLSRIKFDPARDRLWIVGDLVNRGPKSAEVVRYVRSLGPAAITVLGNHDLHLLATAAGVDAKKNKDTFDDILAAPDCDELLHWLRHQPMLHHDAALGWTMVHAGLAPQWDLAQALDCASELESNLRDPLQAQLLFEHLYGDQPNRWSDDLRGTDRLRFITNCFTRMRFCTREGELDLKNKGEVDKAPAHLLPWFRVPNRRSQCLRIVCGHWSALGYFDGDGVRAIDTGCVWGAQLCASRLDEHAEPEFVPCSSSGLGIESEG